MLYIETNLHIQWLKLKNRYVWSGQKNNVWTDNKLITCIKLRYKVCNSWYLTAYKNRQEVRVAATHISGEVRVRLRRRFRDGWGGKVAGGNPVGAQSCAQSTFLVFRFTAKYWYRYWKYKKIPVWISLSSLWIFKMVGRLIEGQMILI